MAIVKPSGNNDIAVLEEGTYGGVVVQVIGLGVHPKDDRSPEKGEADKILVTVELPDETIEVNGEHKPRWLSKVLNVSLFEMATLYKLIKAADPKADLTQPYDTDNLLGKKVMIGTGITSGGNAKIVSYASVPKGMKISKSVNPLVAYDFYAHDQKIFNDLHDWIQSEIKDAMNYTPPKVDEEVPF